MILAIDGKVAGVIGAEDQIKENAKQAIEKMKNLGLEVAMITGDNKKNSRGNRKRVKYRQSFC